MEDKEMERARLVKEKNDKIDIDEWTTKPTGSKNPALISIKEKLRQRDEEEEADKKRKQQLIEEEEKKQKWSNISALEQQKPDPPKPQGIPRPQVAIQWGQRDKVTPDPQMSGMQTASMKKTMPMVGKMPWLQRSNKSEERQNIYANQTLATAPDTNAATTTSKKSSRFGPPSAVSTSLPPPMVLSNVPPPSSNQLSTSGVAPVPPPTVPQIKQSFNEMEKSSPFASSVETPALSAPNNSNSEGISSAMHRQPVSSRNVMPSQVDINSMLEAAKQHINRAKESRKEETMSPLEESQRAEYSPEIEIPLPPLPAAQDKDPTAMIDTRTEKYSNSKPEKGFASEMDKMLAKEESGSHNLPPGFNAKASTVTVQNATSGASHQPVPSMMGPTAPLQGPPAGSEAHAFFGPPGTNMYATHAGGAMAHMGGNAYPARSQTMHQQPTSEPLQKSEEPDASELAMLGIDPSDFAEFGH